MKNTTSLILIGILGSLFVASNGEEECPLKAAFTESIEACKDKLSEDNAKILKDDEAADNEGIRMFKACIMNHAGILEDKKINIDKIREMMKGHIEEAEMENAMGAFEICRTQAEVGGDDGEVATLFINCFKEAVAAAQAGDAGTEK